MVTVHSTQCTTGAGEYIVQVTGTAQEVEEELATGAVAGTGKELARKEDILGFCHDGTNVIAYYIVRT